MREKNYKYKIGKNHKVMKFGGLNSGCRTEILSLFAHVLIRLCTLYTKVHESSSLRTLMIWFVTSYNLGERMLLYVGSLILRLILG